MSIKVIGSFKYAVHSNLFFMFVKVFKQLYRLFPSPQRWYFVSISYL